MSRRSMAAQMGNEPIDLLASRPTKAKRDRSWEKQARKKQGVATYRGIPPKLNEQVKKVAKELNVPVGDVARAFLEYGLQAHQNGELELQPVLATGKFTLFSSDSG